MGFCLTDTHTHTHAYTLTQTVIPHAPCHTHTTQTPSHLPSHTDFSFTKPSSSLSKLWGVISWLVPFLVQILMASYYGVCHSCSLFMNSLLFIYSIHDRVYILCSVSLSIYLAYFYLYLFT